VSGERTEKPTPRRLREARRRGEVAASRDVTSLGALVAGGAAAVLALRYVAGEIARHLRAGLESAVVGGNVAGAAAAVAGASALLVSVLAPVALAAAGGALAAGLLQTRFLVAPAAAAFRAERLDPARNLRRLASMDQALTIVLALAKAAVALAVAWPPARAALPSLAALPGIDVGALPRAVAAFLSPIALRLVGVAAAFAALDLAVVRLRHARALRMTRDEVRREHRQDEGDPVHKAERRRRHKALVDAPAVGRATCVVVNPTHLAVALLHVRGSDAAPLVLAKGAGAEAARIRATARRAGVPVVRDVRLARALWRLAEVGDEIPVELYDAAAAVLVHVHGLPAEVSS
jgi:flagellar biosynthesis protein FlhB